MHLAEPLFGKPQVFFQLDSHARLIMHRIRYEMSIVNSKKWIFLLAPLERCCILNVWVSPGKFCRLEHF